MSHTAVKKNAGDIRNVLLIIRNTKDVKLKQKSLTGRDQGQDRGLAKESIIANGKSLNRTLNLLYFSIIFKSNCLDKYPPLKYTSLHPIAKILF